MKKFLTVLLALSVVFTYSFGTVFAADPTTGAPTTQAEAYAKAQADLLATKNAVVAGLASEYNQTVGTLSGAKAVVIAKSVYTQVAEKIYSDYMSVLAAQNTTTTGATNFTSVAALSGATTYGTLDGKGYKDVDTQDEFKALLLATGANGDAASIENNEYFKETLRLALDSYKSTVKAELDKIDLNLYSDDLMDKDAAYPQTYKQLAADTKAELVKAVDDEVITSETTGSGIVSAYQNIAVQMADTKITVVSTYAAVSGTVTLSYKFKDNTVSDGAIYLVTKDELKDAAAGKDATIASKKAEVAAKAATYYASATAAQRDAYKKTADAYTEVMNSRIENAANPSNIDVSNSAVNATNPKWEDITATYAALKAKVDAFKVMVDATGKLMYDATKLDKNLAEAQIALYANGTTIWTDAQLTANAKNEAEDVQWAKDVKIAALNDARDAKLYGNFNADKYYDIEKAKIIAKYDEVIAKVNAAATVAQVDAISTSVTVSEKEKGDVVTAIKGLSKFSTEYASLSKYVEYMNGDTKSWQDGYKAMMSEDDLAKFYAEKGARTSEEIVALAAEAKAACDAIKTAKELKDAKAAVEELVKALPSQIALTDKDAVQSAWTAADDFGATIDNQAKLDNAVAQLKAVQLKAFSDAYDKLPAVDKITLADKATVDALVADIKAYKETAMFDDAGYNAINMTNYSNAVRDAAKKDVVDAIAALPANATKAEVEAARAKYDAFVKEYTDTSATPAYKAADQILNLDKLLYAEAQIKADEADLSKLTLKTTTKKVGKKVRVYFKITGDVPEGAYIQVWKSKNAVKYNFSKKVAGTAKSTLISKTYNGKNYVKYRVVIVNEDGTKTFSAWSSVGCRIVRK